jgi:hypothetical protein
MGKRCRGMIDSEKPLVVLDRVERFAKECRDRGEGDACYAMPLKWILSIAEIIREKDRKNVS